MVSTLVSKCELCTFVAEKLTRVSFGGREGEGVGSFYQEKKRDTSVRSTSDDTTDLSLEVDRVLSI